VVTKAIFKALAAKPGLFYCDQKNIIKALGNSHGLRELSVTAAVSCKICKNKNGKP
jgi:hypothetical protein